MGKGQLIAVLVSVGFLLYLVVCQIVHNRKRFTGLLHCGDYPPMPPVKPPKDIEDDKLLEQVLNELDFAVGELQRAKVTIGMLTNGAEGEEARIFRWALDCMDNRIKSGKATMMLAGYTPITYRDDENRK